jgi:NADPH2:quinone reductase
MKAVVITRPGDAGVLEICEVPTPQAQENEARVRVRAVGLNRADILQRMGRYPAPPGSPQDIPGIEFAGEVDQLGPHAQNLTVGQKVFGLCGGGAYAEHVVVRADHLAGIPDNLSWEEAAAVPEAFITAYDAVFSQAQLQAGESLLVHAAGSGVGTAAIQLARAHDANAYGTSRTAKKLERASELGLQQSVVLEKDPLVLVDEVKKWTNGKGVDVILDLVGAAYFEANLQALAQKGRLILVGTTSGAEATLKFGVVMSKRLTIRGTVLRSRSDEEKAEVTKAFATNVVPLLANGSVKPVVDRSYRMSEVQEAHRRMEADENFGKIVLTID